MLALLALAAAAHANTKRTSLLAPRRRVVGIAASGGHAGRKRGAALRGGAAQLQPCFDVHVPLETTGGGTRGPWFQSPRERAKALSLAILLVQNSALTLTMRYSRTRVIEHRYHASEAVCLSELTKLFISLALTARAEPGDASFWQRLKGAAESTYADPTSYVLVVPATLYAVQNNLQYVAASNLEPAVFQLLYQMKLLTTAFFSVVLLDRRLAPMQWGGVALLALGLAVVATSASDPTRLVEKHAVNIAVGSSAVLAACCTSGFSSVYFERVVKGSREKKIALPNERVVTPAQKPISVWARNAQMATFSTGIALFGCLCKDGRVIRERGALAGFTPIVWSVVALQATGGLCAAAVIAYADNLLKGFATGGSMLLSTFISWLWLGFEITPGFALGASLVLGSMWVYASAESPS